MTTVFFERGGYAEKIATFEHDEHYGYIADALEDMATALGFDRVTESEDA